MQALGDKYYISTNKLKRKTILRKPEVSTSKTLALHLPCHPDRQLLLSWALLGRRRWAL